MYIREKKELAWNCDKADTPNLDYQTEKYSLLIPSCNILCHSVVVYDTFMKQMLQLAVMAIAMLVL